MFLIYLIDLVSSMSSSGYDADVIQWPDIYTHFWVPSFFPTSTNGNDQGDFDLAIIFAANISARFINILSFIQRILFLIGGWLPISIFIFTV